MVTSMKSWIFRLTLLNHGKSNLTDQCSWFEKLQVCDNFKEKRQDEYLFFEFGVESIKIYLSL